jgi:branched-chain amino acid aminotransferase
MRVRYDVLAEPAYTLGTDSRLLIALMPLKAPTPSMYDRGVSLGLASGLVRKQPLAKTANFAAQRRAILRNKQDVEDYLILDEKGYILEGASSNFYGIRKGVVWTAGEGILQGVTRQIILNLLSKIGIPLCLNPIHLDEVNTLEEAAISSSSRGFLPAIKIDKCQVGTGYPGSISKQIMAAYNEYVAQNTKTALDSLIDVKKEV